MVQSYIHLGPSWLVAPQPHSPFFFTEKDLPERDEQGSEIDEFARGRGFSYSAVTRRAARGDPKALKQFFVLADGVDGAAGYSCGRSVGICF